MSDTRILPTADGYDIRRVDTKVLIHLGMVRRDGREWVARTPRGGSWTSAPSRREAIAYLVEADAVAHLAASVS